MQLIIVRHAIAEDREDFKKKSLDDRLRPLTLKGRKKMQKIAMEMREKIKDVELIITSPFTRAKQTAEILSQIFVDIPVVEAPELTPQSPPAAFAKWLKSHAKDCKKIMAVGHEPHLSHLMSWFLSGSEEAFIELKKGGSGAIEFESFAEVRANAGHLLWLLQPKHWDE
ncbi:MAG: histidine phosphatase family protein [Pseudobdellovibrionaceae bacterium]